MREQEGCHPVFWAAGQGCSWKQRGLKRELLIHFPPVTPTSGDPSVGLLPSKAPFAHSLTLPCICSSLSCSTLSVPRFQKEKDATAPKVPMEHLQLKDLRIAPPLLSKILPDICPSYIHISPSPDSYLAPTPCPCSLLHSPISAWACPPPPIL